MTIATIIVITGNGKTADGDWFMTMKDKAIKADQSLRNSAISDSVPERTLSARLAEAEALAKREGWSADYVNGYCGECDEEYNVPETADEPERCPICGTELDTL